MPALSLGNEIGGNYFGGGNPLQGDFTLVEDTDYVPRIQVWTPVFGRLIAMFVFARTLLW